LTNLSPRSSPRLPILLLLVSLRVFAADQFAPVRESIQAKLPQRHVASLAVGVAKGDKILWEQGFGWANREKRISADAHTMYSLASISKPMTATALMTLVKAGKIDLDKPVNNYLESAKIRARIGDVDQATVRRVANHSSGLPEHYQFFYDDEPWRPPSADETIRRFGNLLTAPGEYFRYSNLGYRILSYIISRVSGLTYADYMRQEVFLKLGLSRTSAAPTPELTDYQAVRYGQDGQPIARYEFDHDGASAVCSSVHDLLRFAMFHQKLHLPDQVAILPDNLIDAMQTPTMDEGAGEGYGIGWDISHDSGTTVVSHSGGMPGVASWLRIVPSEKLTVVVLSNSDDRLAHIISDEIMEVMIPGWKPAPNPPSSAPGDFVPPKEIIGVWKGKVATYQSAIPFTLRVESNGDIHVELGNQLKTLLNRPHFSSDEFLQGVFAGSIGIPDATRRPYVLTLNLKLRNGNILSGAISAKADEPGTMPAFDLVPAVVGQPRPARIQKQAFILTQWAELSKQ